MTFLSRPRAWLSKLALPSNFGEWATSWRLWVITGLVRFPILDQRLLRNHDHYFDRLLPALLVAYAASGVPLLIANKTVFRNRGTKMPNFLIGVVVWMLADIVLNATAFWLLGPRTLKNPNIVNPLYMAIHAFFTIPIGATICTALCLLALSRQNAEALRVSVGRQQLMLRNLDSYLQTVRRKFSNQVSKSLVPGFERIKQEVIGLVGAENQQTRLGEFAERVRMFSISEVRNLSHEIADSEIDLRVASEGALDKIFDAGRFSSNVIAPADAALVGWLYLSFGLALEPNSDWRRVALGALAAAAATFAFQRVARRLQLQLMPAKLSLLVASLFLPSAVATAVEATLDSRVAPQSRFWFAFSMIVLTFAINYPYRYFSAISERLERAEAEVALVQNRLRVKATAIRESFSRVIHGKIQGRLALVSYVLGQIEQKPLGENQVQVERLLSLLDSIETELASLAAPSERKGLSAAAEALAGEWSGLVTITFDIDETSQQMIAGSGELESELSSLIEEAVLNARVHGGADSVSILLNAIDGYQQKLTLSISDNGIGIGFEREAGLGSRHLSAVCESWQLQRTAGELTCLTAIIDPAAFAS